MLFCGGDPILFGCFAGGTVLFIVGGALWGQGTEYDAYEKYIAGIVVLTIGLILYLLGVIAAVHNFLKERKKQKEEKEKIEKFIKEFEDSQEADFGTLRCWSRESQGEINPAFRGKSTEDINREGSPGDLTTMVRISIGRSNRVEPFPEKISALYDSENSDDGQNNQYGTLEMDVLGGVEKSPNIEDLEDGSSRNATLHSNEPQDVVHNQGSRSAGSSSNSYELTMT